MEHMPIDKLLGLLNIFNEAICLPVPDSGSLNVLRLFSFTLNPRSCCTMESSFWEDSR